MGLPGPKTQMSLQASTETNSAFGLTTTWVTEGVVIGILTKHAGVRLSYKETESASRPTVFATYTFFCDVPSYTITEKKRFILGSRIFNILHIYNPAQANHHLEIELQEVF